MANLEKNTHFGFKTIKEDDKASLVQDVFTKVASKYDLMNDLMSLGVHRLWKDAMLDWLAPRQGQKILDVAGGTGDIAFRVLARTSHGANVTVLDMTADMLCEGKKRGRKLRVEEKIEWVCGDAMALPFRDNSFDIYTIAFGIRNVTRIADALLEAYRVLRPGGRLLVLEFSSIPDRLLQDYYDLYSFKIIPQIGKIVTGDKASYQYLVESIRNFPNQNEFCDIITSCGFEAVKYRNLSLGIAALHSGWKI